jgi:hypothetical protein
LLAEHSHALRPRKPQISHLSPNVCVGTTIWRIARIFHVLMAGALGRPVRIAPAMPKRQRPTRSHSQVPGTVQCRLLADCWKTHFGNTNTFWGQVQCRMLAEHWHALRPRETSDISPVPKKHVPKFAQHILGDRSNVEMHAEHWHTSRPREPQISHLSPKSGA